jgi:hypothetical protein
MVIPVVPVRLGEPAELLAAHVLLCLVLTIAD